MRRRRMELFFKPVVLAGLLVACLAFVGCSGDDGSSGAAGKSAYEIAVDNGFTGTEQEWLASLDPNNPATQLANVEPESCVICHGGTGDDHQAVYDAYADASAFTATIDSVTSVAQGTTPETYNTTVTFTILKNGQPYLDIDGLPSIDQKRIVSVTYDSATRVFDNDETYGNIKALGGGQYTAEVTGIGYAPEATNAQVYMYIADGALESGDTQLYGDVANVGVEFGDVDTYESTANVSGCEKCHGTPYMKHGYRAAAVAGLPDFAACKACHYDTRNGSHQAWQLMVDDPAYWASGAALTDEQKAKYAYKASVMNDTHMSHAMEFPYPQSMANCATCHEGKLDRILTQDNFVVATCKSCHPVDGGTDRPDPNSNGDLVNAYDTTKLALNTIMPSWHDLSTIAACNTCHLDGNTTGAKQFSSIHTGFDAKIYDATGTKYANVIKAQIDSVTLTGTDLDIKFSASGTVGTLKAEDIVPTVLVAFYGYDTKDFLVSNHTSDANKNRMEKTIGTDNALFTEVATGTPGTWEVILDLSAYAATPSIPDMIAAGTVKMAEIAVEPALKNAAGDTVGLNAPSKTFDLNANDFAANYYSGTKAIVDVENGCNTCHDQLATTFHSGNRGGNIVVCRMCHVTTSGGSHLEMQSRSIDSYVHAVHSFQPFDVGSINFDDPVEAAHYTEHTEFVYPMFTRLACESCHKAGTYNAPNQAKSLPGILSKSAAVADRNIADVPSYVTGPASRACGGCHRADLINEDAAGELSALNIQHVQKFGYLIESTDSTTLGTVIEKIMPLFQ